MQVGLQYEPTPRAPHVVHHSHRGVRGEVRGGRGAAERGRLPPERVLVPNGEPAAPQPPERVSRVPRDDILEIVQRGEQRPTDVPPDLSRGVREAARHRLEHHASHAILRDPRAQRFAGGDQPRAEFPRHG